MAVWASTIVLVLVLLLIVRSEVRCGRKSKQRQIRVDQEINELARSTFSRHRAVFGREPTDTFPLVDGPPVTKN